MGKSQTTLIHWQDTANHVLLNPRWPALEADSLKEVAQKVSEQFQLQGHIWLATSGSTAGAVTNNKLVALSKNAFLSSAASVNEHLSVTDKDIWLQVLPRFHVGGLGIEVRAELSHSLVVTDLERWQPHRMLQILQQGKITLASLVPAQVFDLVQAGLQAPPTLRAVIVGGGALTNSLYQAARKLGWHLLPSYGMTETCSQIATATLESLSASQMPLPTKLRHAECRVSSEGLLEVSGSSLLTCYGQRQMDGTIKGWDPKSNGWFQSEDFVKLQHHQIQFLGRRNDFIKIGGEGSSMGRLREIFERVLLSLNAGAAGAAERVALIDAPSQRLGIEIHLVHSADMEQRLLLELKEKYNQEVLPFERIRELKQVSRIPRSDLGKVLWAQLKRELYVH